MHVCSGVSTGWMLRFAVRPALLSCVWLHSQTFGLAAAHPVFLAHRWAPIRLWWGGWKREPILKPPRCVGSGGPCCRQVARSVCSSGLGCGAGWLSSSSWETCAQRPVVDEGGTSSVVSAEPNPASGLHLASSSAGIKLLTGSEF